jgi:hypothetical protein
LEEHDFDAELIRHCSPKGALAALRAKLDDLGDVRISAMDAAVIDLQVLSRDTQKAKIFYGKAMRLFKL